MKECCDCCGLLLDNGYCHECESYDDGTGVDLDKCPYCRGTGYVNPLTAPEYQFCIGTEECAACDGEGHIR